MPNFDQLLTEKAKSLVEFVDRSLPNSECKFMVLSKIQEAVWWAHKGDQEREANPIEPGVNQ